MSISVASPIVNLPEQAVDPDAVTDEAVVYSKDASGIAQMFVRSDDGTVHQITPAASPTDVELPDNDDFAYLAHEGLNEYLRMSTQNANEFLELGARAMPIFYGSTVGGIHTHTFIVSDNSFAFVVSRAADSTRFLRLESGAGTGRWTFGNVSQVLLQIEMNIPDNQTDAVLVRENTNNYIRVNTNNGTETIQLGNATTNPSVNLLGDGAAIFNDGEIDQTNRAADPGGTLLHGKTYVKDVAGVTQLFFQRSDGSVVQVT